MSQKCKQPKLEKVVADTIKTLKKDYGIPKIIVALSGGADSVALLSALASLRAIPMFKGLELLAAHCNFHLRGEESNRDSRFASDICNRLNIPIVIKDFDVDAFQSLHPSCSLEMACRDLRYDWFRTLMKEQSAKRIATGHNADDNIETLFLNLLRGSGTTGLRGMLPDNGYVIRPLLSIHRKEIIDYLKGRDLGFITDSSNLTSDFRRNYIRNEILPMLRQRWPGLDKALDRSIYLIKTENSIVERSVADALPPDGLPLTRENVLSYPAPELLVRRYILPLQPVTTTAAEIVSAMRANKPDIRTWNLPGGRVILRGGRLLLQPVNPINK